MYKFYDTCSLLTDASDLTDVIISSKSIEELENIKTSSHKDESIKFKARVAVRNIKEQKPRVIVVCKDDYEMLDTMGLEITNDNLIISCADRTNIDTPVIFYTEDYLCGLIAKEYFNLTINSLTDKKADIYKGHTVHRFKDDNDMAIFYESLDENTLGLITNQYVVLEASDGTVVDTVKWNGTKYVALSTKNFKSNMFGMIKPKPNDPYQLMVFDSLLNNDITVIFGKAGSGKTLLSLAYIMNQLDSNKFSKLNVIHSFETLKNAKTLGYVKGSQEEKLLNTSSVGNILTSKFGDKTGVERMMACGMLEIVPTANIRGVQYDSDDIVFITEGQNLDTYTLKTVLQRCAEGCKVIIEGDILEQSDIGRESGLFKMIDIFKGYEQFGCVKLKNNYRSKASELADLM